MKLYYSENLPVLKHTMTSKFIERRLDKESFVKTEEINGMNSIEFTLNLLDDDEADQFQKEVYFLLVDDDGSETLYIVEECVDSSDRTLSLKCLRVEFMLSYIDYIDQERAFAAGTNTPLDVLNYILEGTNFEINSLVSTLTEGLSEPYIVPMGSKLEALQNFIKKFKLEYEVIPSPLEGTIATLVFKNRIGVEKGIRYKLGKRVTGITVSTDRSEQATYIKPVGAGGLTLPEGDDVVKVPDSELPNLGLSAHRRKVVTFSEVTADSGATMESVYSKLRALANEYLEEHKAGVINVTLDYQYENINDFYYFRLGDTLTVKYRTREFRVRVMSKSTNPFTKQVRGLKLSNYRVKDFFEFIDKAVSVVDVNTGLVIPEKIAEGEIAVNTIYNSKTGIGLSFEDGIKNFLGEEVRFNEFPSTDLIQFIEGTNTDTLTINYKDGRPPKTITFYKDANGNYTQLSDGTTVVQIEGL